MAMWTMTTHHLIWLPTNRLELYDFLTIMMSFRVSIYVFISIISINVIAWSWCRDTDEGYDSPWTSDNVKLTPCFNMLRCFEEICDRSSSPMRQIRFHKVPTFRDPFPDDLTLSLTAYYIFLTYSHAIDIVFHYKWINLIINIG